MNQIRLHGRIVKSKEGLNEGVLNSHMITIALHIDSCLLYRIYKRIGVHKASGDLFLWVLSPFFRIIRRIGRN